MLEQFRIFLFESQLLPVFLVILMALSVWSGRHLGLYEQKKASGTKLKPDEISVAAIFGLMSLLVAFTFSGAYERFEKRRVLLVDEYNTISTAYLSIDLLPTKLQPALRDDFRKLMDERAMLYTNVVDQDLLHSRQHEFEKTIKQLWKDAASAVSTTPYPQNLVAAQLLTAVSAMSDALENRKMALKQHPPMVIYTLLILLLLIGAFIAGYNQATSDTKDWILVPIYVLVTVVVFYVTINLEHPLVGVITLDDFHAEVISLRQQMK